MIGSGTMTLRLIVLSMIRLAALFTVIIMLLYYRVVNPFGLLAGFTVIFVLILIEGLRSARAGGPERE